MTKVFFKSRNIQPLWPICENLPLLLPRYSNTMQRFQNEECLVLKNTKTHYQLWNRTGGQQRFNQEKGFDKLLLHVYSPSRFGQETAKGPYCLRVKLPPAHLSNTRIINLKLHTIPFMLNVKQNGEQSWSVETTFLFFVNKRMLVTKWDVIESQRCADEPGRKVVISTPLKIGQFITTQAVTTDEYPSSNWSPFSCTFYVGLAASLFCLIYCYTRRKFLLI